MNKKYKIKISFNRSFELIFLIFGGLIILSRGSVTTPFFYTIF